MATSLAEQLQRLKVPQTTNLKRDKKRPSLIFDPKEAAGLTRETVYQIGLDGIEHLISKNAAFEQFYHNLFHASSKDFERSVQDAEANKRLDKNIRKFFLLLSPYFLLNCSHKALEWLVHRFYIHDYNRKDFLMLIFPYHESNIFVRAVQLMKFKDTSDNFYFLKSLQKSGVHLTKHTLLTHAASDPAFLNFTSKFISSMVKEHKNPSVLTVAFNFYCTIFTGVLEFSTEINETQISAILPAIIKGLSSDVPDFVAGSYVITARLVAKQEVLDKLLNKFVEKISLVKVSTLKTEAVLVLIVLYQSQKNYDNFPLKAVKNLMDKEWLFNVLESLNGMGTYIYPFLEKLVKFTIQYGLEHDEDDSYKLFINKLLAQMKFDKCFVETFFNVTLDAVNFKNQYSEETMKWINGIINTLETQYPEEFDKQVYTILSSTKKSHRNTSLKHILKSSLMIKQKFDIFQKLNHPNPEIRNHTLKFIVKKYDTLKENEKTLIKNSFIDRLNDDNLEVLKETLNVVLKIKILDQTVLKNLLKNLMMKCHKNKTVYSKIYYDVLKVLCEVSNCNDYDVFLAIFPYFVTNSEGEIKNVLENLKGTSFVLNNKLLELSNFTSKNFYETFIDGLNNNTTPQILEEFLTILNEASNENLDSYEKYLIMLFLSNILPFDTSLDITARIVDIFFTYFKDSKLKSNKKIKINKILPISSYLEIAKLNKIHPEAFLSCLSEVISKIEMPNVNLNVFDFNSESISSSFFTSVANMMFSKLESENTEKFLNSFCGNSENFKMKIEFILNLAVSSSQNDNFTELCLSALIFVLNKNNERLIDLNESKIVVPYLLVLLSNSEENIRIKAIEILLKISERIKIYAVLIKGVLSQKEEIILDCLQVTQVLSNVFSNSSTKKDLNCLLQEICEKNNPQYLISGLLNVISQISGFDIFENIAKSSLEILENNDKKLNDFQSNIISRNIDRINSDVSNKITLKSNVWKLIEICLKNDSVELIYFGRKTCPMVLISKQIDRDTFENLNRDIQKRVIDLILEITTTTQNSEVSPAASKIFKHIDLDAELILEHLCKMRDTKSKNQSISQKKRRVCIIPTVDILDLHDWKKGVTVLEYIQDKKKLFNTDRLLGVVFDILKKCLDFDEQTAVEYPKQLLLSLILVCTTRLQDKSLPKSIFNVELIVQCIRASPNPQTHHHALLVLAESANLIPTDVLHHMMAIFTFMGSSLLRYDDAYSFHIINKIIDTIIPILVNDGSLKTRGSVLRVFVDAFLDVPEHRRMPMYTHLLKMLSLEDNLYLFLLLIFESQVLHASEEKDLKGKDERSLRRLSLTADLCRQFDSEIIIKTCIKLVEYLKLLPDEKDNFKTNKSDVITFDIMKHTDKHFRHYKYVIITFTANLLASNEFVYKVSENAYENLEDMEKLYKDLIVNVLMYIQQASKTLEKNTNSPQHHYWKVILHHSYDLLDSVNALLTPEMFLLVVKGLMQHTLLTVRKRTLELLNTKLQFDTNFFTEDGQNDLLQLIPSLISIVDMINTEKNLESEQEIIIQTALLSIKLLVKLKAHEHPDKFTKILEYLTNLMKSSNIDSNVLASIVLCLAELCSCLGAHVISYMPQFIPAILKLFRQQKHLENPQSLLLLSILTSIYKILESVPLFLSPYLLKLLTELSLLMNKFESLEDDPKAQPIIKKLNDIQIKIAVSIPCRVIFPVVQECFNKLVEKNCFNSVGSLMNIFTECITNLQGTDINNSLPELTTFFLSALQFRTDNKCSLNEINTVENQIIKAITSFVLKLSENSFRPLYYKIFDWAVRCDVKNERIITFYNFSSKISAQLKGLFILFAGHFLNNASQVLDLCNTVKNEQLYFKNNDDENVLLLSYILKTLHNIFYYDNHKFVTKDRFETLMQPLVDQLENTLGGINELEKRNVDVLTPCIVQFVVATADDSLWKQLNYQVLLKMRHTSPKIRLIALHCLTEIVKKLGEDFLSLLPETIPFLAELMEDEEEYIEKACKKSIQEMEKYLGDSLQKYF